MSRSKKRLDPSQVFRSVRTRRRRFRVPHPHRWWTWTLLISLVAAAALGGWGVWYYRALEEDIQDKDIKGVTPAKKHEPFVALLVGSDSRKGLTPEDQDEIRAHDAGPGERADTLILARVDPETNRVVLVQFPRDLYVEIPGVGNDKINKALEHGDGTLVRTVGALTGLQVNHYVKVNIAGFRQLVDAIDGVDVCITDPIAYDDHTGLQIKPDELGMVHFNGLRALQFVRSRSVFARGDFDRIRNQQTFVAASVDKVLSAGTFLDVGRIKDVIDVARLNVDIDEHTNLRELVSISRRFRSFDPDLYEAYSAPDLGIADNEAGSVVLPDDAALEAMFEALRANKSPATASEVPAVGTKDIVVGVYNGIGRTGAAEKAAGKLVAATTTGDGKITIEDIENAGRFGHKTTIVRYDDEDPDARAKGEFIVAALPGARLESGETDPDVDVAVIVGKSFTADRIIQIKPIPLPEPGRLPKICRE